MRIHHALALVCLFLSGCGPSDPPSGGPKKLVIWQSYNPEETKVFKEVVATFQEEQRAKKDPIEIVVNPVPFDGLLPKLKAACLTGTTPDICRVDYAHVVPMAYGNAILPLDSAVGLPASDLDKIRQEYIPAAIDSCLLTIRRDGKVERHLYGLPDQTNCIVLFYNRALYRESAAELKAAGLNPDATPRNWDEFIQYAKVLTIPKKSQYGVALDNSLWWALPFLNTYGARILDQDPATGYFTSVLDNSKAIAGLTLRVSLSRERYQLGGISTPVEAGAWIPGALNKDQGFATGHYAMVFSGPWNLDTYRNNGVDFGVGQIPAGPAGSWSTVGGTNMVVFKSCRHPREAWEFLRYLTSAPVQQKWASRLGQIPVRPDVFGQVDTQSKPALKVFFDQMLKTVARPPVPNYDKVEEIANAQMDLALQGVKSPQEALHEASDLVNSQVLAPMREGN